MLTEENRTEIKDFQTHRFFADQEIMRIEGTGDFPILVMKKIDYDPLDSLDDQGRIEAFDSVLSILIENGLVAGDTELVINQNTGRPMFIDVGGFMRIDVGYRPIKVTGHNGMSIDAYPDLTDKEVYQAVIISNLLMHFSNLQYPCLRNPRAVHDILASSGIDGVRELLNIQASA